MAIYMFPAENSSLGTSPRISFSHDILHTDSVTTEHYPRRLDSSLLDSDSEFDFCITQTSEKEVSAADELFSGGLIRPLKLQETLVITPKHKSISKPQLPLPSFPPLNESSPQESVSLGTDSQKKQESKSFWRSSSVHVDNSYKKGSFWSLPSLSRSKSTGSVSKQMSKDSQKQQNSHKIAKGSMVLNSSSSVSSRFYTYPLSQKPPLKKNYGGSNGKGVRISPVLNVPPPYIAKGTANLFGLSAFFGNNSKDKKNKK